MQTINLTKLNAALLENMADYSDIMTLKMANGFELSRKHFTRLQIRDKVPLIRATSFPVVQPGRTGTVNFNTNVLEFDDRIGELRPCKFDIRIPETTIYAWSKSYLANRQPTDPSDVYSMPALSFYMSLILAQVGKDVHSALYNGVYNAAGGNAVSIVDGYGLLLPKGIAAVSDGGDADIPTQNLIASATTITQANILAELNKFALRILDNLPEYIMEDADLYLPPAHYGLMVNALDASLSNGSQVVYWDPAEQTYRLRLAPGTRIVLATWLVGKQHQIWTVRGNFFWLTNELNSDVPSIDTEKADRAIKVFGDFSFDTDYGDGRLILMNDKFTVYDTTP